MLVVQSQSNAQMGQVMSCDNFGDDHSWDQCPSQAKLVNYIGNFNMNQNNPCLNTYNPGWRNNPNFGWGGNQSSGQKLLCQVQSQAQILAPSGFEANTKSKM